MKRKPPRGPRKPSAPGPEQGRDKRDRFHSPSRPPAGPAAGRREGRPDRPRPAPPRAATPPAAAPAGAAPVHRQAPRGQPSGLPWVYGTHAVLAALANRARRIARIVATPEAKAELGPRLAAQEAARGETLPPAETLPRPELEKLLPRGAVHQGLAIQAGDLEPLDIDDLLRLVGDLPRVRIVALDQVTDPHNVGAILRSAAAFGAAAVILPERHAPAASAVMAKSASGALETVPLVRVVNLARALDSLKAANIWCVGLAGSAGSSIAEADLSGRIALVLGSEGEGLRRLTRERCDMLVRIPIAAGAVESLNVSNAAAIALYEAARR
jgi:23S rRNA (guanosine2251-2'-O)-methyltransferase